MARSVCKGPFVEESLIKKVEKVKNDTNRKQIQEPRRIITKKIGRNEPCPCGSGKKYKQCHGN